jgi:hypothetical protein
MESTPKKRKLENDLNLNTSSPKRSRRELSLKEKYDSLKLKNVTLRFLPPNTTSKLQPLDLGIIRAFKARYTKHMLKHPIAKIDMCDDKISFTKEINVLDAIHWVNRSWTETKETTIVTWFRDAGFPLQCPTEIHSEEESDPDDDIPLAQLTLCGSSRGRN